MDGVVGGVGDESVEHLVCGSAELVVLSGLGDLEQVLGTCLPVLRESVGLAARLASKAVSKVHQSPAAAAGHLGVRAQAAEQRSNKLGEVLRVD